MIYRRAVLSVSTALFGGNNFFEGLVGGYDVFVNIMFVLLLHELSCFDLLNLSGESILLRFIFIWSGDSHTYSQESRPTPYSHTPTASSRQALQCDGILSPYPL
jgi:hypothetical protein